MASYLFNCNTIYGRCEKICTSNVALIQKILLSKFVFFIINIIGTYWERYDINITLNHVILIRTTISVKFIIN
jgi:hypothetical protein